MFGGAAGGWGITAHVDLYRERRVGLGVRGHSCGGPARAKYRAMSI